MLKAILLGCLFGISAGENDGWSYDDIPEWSYHYTNCKGTEQSPINVVKSNVRYSSALANSITYSKYNNAGSGKQFKVENNGHSFQLDVASVGASISLKDMYTYKLQQFHFHWGSDDTKGSEHQIDGKSYPAELHLVHYKSSYNGVTDAKNRTYGLAVIGILIQEGKENAAFQKFLNLTKYNVTLNGTSTMVDAFKVEEVLPANRTNFYRYHGSLTTPTCDQTVTWSLMAEPIEISSDQLNEFRKLMSHGKYLVNNYRPVQMTDNRDVTSSFDMENAGSSIKASWFAVSLITFFILAFV